MRKLIIVTALVGIGLVYGVKNSEILKTDIYKGSRDRLEIAQLQERILSGDVDINDLSDTSARINCNDSNFGIDYLNNIYVVEKDKNLFNVIYGEIGSSEFKFGVGYSDDFFTSELKVSDKNKKGLEQMLKIANYCYDINPENIKLNNNIYIQ